MAVPMVLPLDRFCGICFKMTWCITTVPALTLCADDHQLYAAGETHRTVESGLKTQGHLAPSWYKNNSLLPNPEKFQSLTVNPRNIKAENDDKTLYIDRIMTSEKTEQINLLGVYIDENLNFAGHISELCTRASQKVGILVHL